MAERVYFRGLDGLRAIAASGVMVSHVLSALHHFHGHAHHAGLELANQSVVVFFTLSGFLITFLLLRERDQLGDIDLRAFYVRRILRIWPLYFFYIALAMTCHALFDPQGVPNASYVILFICFIPNIAFNLNRYMPDTGPLWSIGIEEQFYALWPLVVRHVRKLSRLLVAVIVCVLGARVAMHVAHGGGKHLAVSVLDSIGYDSMAIGALFAIAYRRAMPTLLRVARSPFVAVVFLGWIALLATNQLYVLSLAVTPTTSALTGLFILNQIDDRKKLVDLEQPGIRYLGRISFGIYVYNPLMVSLLVWITGDRRIPAFGLVLLVSAMTIAVASLSYRFLEKPFLRLKDRFAHIKTTA